MPGRRDKGALLQNPAKNGKIELNAKGSPGGDKKIGKNHMDEGATGTDIPFSGKRAA